MGIQEPIGVSAVRFVRVENSGCARRQIGAMCTPSHLPGPPHTYRQVEIIGEKDQALAALVVGVADDPQRWG